ncbi:MAG TPA: hypothetical protein VIV40_17485 [Kofleriaceae bacterium]
MRALLLVVLVGCASSAAIPQVRFANAPPVLSVDDRRDTPNKPEKRLSSPKLATFEGHIYFPIRRALSLDQRLRALGVNALDEVPDSSWFTNRIGTRTITPDEISAAPGGVGSPEAHVPWTIHSTKVGGMTVGFIVSDSRGEKFLVKFDDRGFPEAETGAQIVSGKLLWACGYNVTEDYIAYVKRSDFVLAEDAVAEDVFGNKHHLGITELERKLALVDRGPDGRYRTMVSRMLDGKPLGSHGSVGTRDDDPNDIIPHERRRDLRGARAIFAWLDHDDVQEGQFIDMWVEDPNVRTRHYVKHYFLDYGLSLGVMALVTHNLRRSYEYYIDGEALLDALFSFGLQDRHWAKRRAPDLRGVGVLETKAFAPDKWKPLGPVYVPFVVADRFDNYWGAKLVMRFTREQIHAAVEAGRYSDPRAVDYITDALVARQRSTGAYWFSRVNPLESFVIGDDGSLCFDDLLLTYRFAKPDTTTYTLQSYDTKARRVGGKIRLGASDNGRTCARIRLASDRDRYTIVRIDTARSRDVGTIYVHLANTPGTGVPRVIGIWRP